ncbi:Polycystin-2 [Diplonema papillatum]|nr:Polycystin-2 [Diplonema papillatum]
MWADTAEVRRTSLGVRKKSTDTSHPADMSQELSKLVPTGEAVDDSNDDYAPEALWLDAPSESLRGATGGYQKLPGETSNGQVVWQGGGSRRFYLHTNSEGKWVLASSRHNVEQDQDCGLVAAEAGGMPHTVKTWLVHGIFSEHVHFTPNPAREATVYQLLTFLIQDDQRSRHYMHLPFYLVFLASLTVSACLFPNGLSKSDHSSMFWLQRGIRDKMEVEQLQDISNEADMWEWIEEVVPALWNNSGGFAAVPSAPELAFNWTSRDLASDLGLPLTTKTLFAVSDCRTLCEQTPACQSIAYSTSCYTCTLYDKCLTDNEASTTPSDACKDVRSHFMYGCRPEGNEDDIPGDFSLSCTQDTSSVKDNTFTCLRRAYEERVFNAASQQNYALGYMMLRQWRVAEEACPDRPGVIIPAESILPRSCSYRYSSDTSSATPYSGIRNGSITWIADGDVSHAFGGPVIGTPRTTFRRHADRFTSAFSFLSYREKDVLDELAQMSENAWVDKHTRLITVDTIMYSPSSEGYFVYTAAWIEFLETGVVLPGIAVYPFAITALDSGRNVVAFVFDIIVTSCAVVFIVSFVRCLWNKHCLLKAAQIEAGAFGTWESFEVVHVGLLVTLSYFRWSLWDQSFDMNSETFIDSHVGDTGGDAEKLMWNWLAYYATMYEYALIFFSLSIIMSYLRVFKYVQFNSRLNALSETIKGAYGDMVGMTLIFVIVACAYSFGGVLLFGSSLEQYRRFGTALSYLIRLLFTADMDAWEGMRDLRPYVAWIFMMSYFVLSWLVLLNMVLAIIAGSFAVVQENLQRKSSWRARKVQSDVLKFLKRFISINKGEKTGARNGSVGGGLFYAVAEVVCGHDPRGKRHRMLLGLVREWATEKKKRLKKRKPDLSDSSLDDRRLYVTALEFRELCLKVTPPLSAKAEINRLFIFAQRQLVSGENSRARESERRLEAMNEKLEMLEMQVRHVSNSSFSKIQVTHDALAELKLLILAQADQQAKVTQELDRIASVQENMASQQASDRLVWTASINDSKSLADQQAKITQELDRIVSIQDNMASQQASDRLAWAASSNNNNNSSNNINSDNRNNGADPPHASGVALPLTPRSPGGAGSRPEVGIPVAHSATPETKQKPFPIARPVTPETRQKSFPVAQSVSLETKQKPKTPVPDSRTLTTASAIRTEAPRSPGGAALRTRTGLVTPSFAQLMPPETTLQATASDSRANVSRSLQAETPLSPGVAISRTRSGLVTPPLARPQTTLDMRVPDSRTSALQPVPQAAALLPAGAASRTRSGTIAGAPPLARSLATDTVKPAVSDSRTAGISHPSPPMPVMRDTGPVFGNGGSPRGDAREGVFSAVPPAHNNPLSHAQDPPASATDRKYNPSRANDLPLPPVTVSTAPRPAKQPSSSQRRGIGAGRGRYYQQLSDDTPIDLQPLYQAA